MEIVSHLGDHDDQGVYDNKRQCCSHWPWFWTFVQRMSLLDMVPLAKEGGHCTSTRLQARTRSVGQSQRCLVEILATAERQFTECWKSWSQEFALSSAALSGAPLNTSSADNNAWISDMGGRMECLGSCNQELCCCWQHQWSNYNNLGIYSYIKKECATEIA